MEEIPPADDSTLPNKMRTKKRSIKNKVVQVWKIPGYRELEQEIYTFLENNKFDSAYQYTDLMRDVIDEIIINENNAPIQKITQTLTPHITFIANDQYHFKKGILNERKRYISELQKKLNNAIEEIKKLDALYNITKFKEYLEESDETSSEEESEIRSSEGASKFIPLKLNDDPVLSKWPDVYNDYYQISEDNVENLESPI